MPLLGRTWNLNIIIGKRNHAAVWNTTLYMRTCKYSLCGAGDEYAETGRGGVLTARRL